ncbi:MAG: hypothetical protein K0U68_12690 [Gammaproteobacteria bacterium]|nr:hypothetical protein [Gammaproteobacteria bacterium]
MTHLIGIAFIIIIGLLLIFLTRGMTSWLPDSIELHQKLLEVQQEKNLSDKVTALTPVILIAFFWFFFGIFFWIITLVVLKIVDVLFIISQMALDQTLALPAELVNVAIQILPGVSIGKPLLYIIAGIVVTQSFSKGVRISKQCWDIYTNSHR